VATVKRSNPTAFSDIISHLKELEGKVGRAGWFESAVYPDGTPVATIAAQNEFGGTINHPGGTPYKIGPDGQAIFVTKAEGAGLPMTKPHTIVIPPRPFMRPTIDREKNNWLNAMAEGAKDVLAGKVSAGEVMEDVAMRAAADVAKTITQVYSPPLKPATIAARRRKMSNQKIVGSLDKPLVASGIMLATVTGKSENA